MKNKNDPTLRDLFPHLTEAELAKASDNLDQYMTLVLRIFERMEQESGYPHPDPLTENNGTLPCTPPAREASA